MSKKYGPWREDRFCVACDQFLNREDFFDNWPKDCPVCVHCGAAGRFGLPEVNKRMRRKVYTTGRRAAVEASRAKNNIFSFVVYRSVMLLRKMNWKERNYVWEYQKTRQTNAA